MKDVPFKIEQQQKDAIFEINENFFEATKVTLKSPSPDKQLVTIKRYPQQFKES